MKALSRRLLGQRDLRLKSRQRSQAQPLHLLQMILPQGPPFQGLLQLSLPQNRCQLNLLPLSQSQLDLPLRCLSPQNRRQLKLLQPNLL